jgi:hypothetical protein
MSKNKLEPKSAIKEATITIRLSPEMEAYIEQAAALLSKSRDDKTTKTYVVTQLMKLGMPAFEQKHDLKAIKLKK